MNELKLSLHNFQSIAEGELTFQTGLNFIIGQSNSGKSATFRALKACLLNPAGSPRFIKKDTNKATVELKYNGNDILWSKAEKANSYFINGEEYRNTGKSDAFKILNDEVGFVKAEKGSFLMNIEEELQLPFPFGLPDSELFKLFENVFCVSDSALILKAAKGYEDKAKDEISLSELEITKVKAKINSLEKLKEEVDIVLLKNYSKQLKEKEQKLESLKDGLGSIKLALCINEANLNANETSFEDLTISYNEALKLRKEIKRVKNLHLLKKELQTIEVVFEPKLEKLRDLKSLKKTVSCIRSLEGLKICTKEYKNVYNEYSELKELSKLVNSLKGLHKIKVEELEFENKLQTLRDLKTIRSYMDKIKGEIQELKANKKREEEKVAEIEEKLKEFKVCPLCHHSLEN